MSPSVWEVPSSAAHRNCPASLAGGARAILLVPRAEKLVEDCRRAPLGRVAECQATSSPRVTAELPHGLRCCRPVGCGKARSGGSTPCRGHRGWTWSASHATSMGRRPWRPTVPTGRRPARRADKQALIFYTSCLSSLVQTHAGVCTRARPGPWEAPGGTANKACEESSTRSQA